MSESLSVKVEASEPSEVRRELRIEVEESVVTARTEEVVERLSRAAHIPGFRKGKVPRSILRQRFAREIENELLDGLVPRAIGQALEQTGLQPLHQPVVGEVELEPGAPLRFLASFDVRPPIEPRDYKGVGIQDVAVEVEEKDVAQELESIREKAAEYEVVDEDRALAGGDHAVVDLVSISGGEERSQEGALIEVGSEAYHPEFSHNLEGARPGDEKSFEVRYEDDDPDPRARGNSVSYRVAVKAIKRKVLPDLDDEFAQDVSEHQTLADLKKEIRAGLEQQLERQRRRTLEQRLAEALMPSAEFEAPGSLVEVELDHALEDQMRMMAMQGIDPRTAPVDWRQTRQQLREQAVRSVKWSLLLDAIADEESIEVSEEDRTRRMEQIADGSGRGLEYVRSRIEKDGKMQEFTATLRRQNTVDFLLHNAKMEPR